MTCTNLDVIFAFVFNSEPNVPLFADDAEDRKAVPLPDLEVGLVVPGRDLDGTGSEFRIDGFVADDRDQ